MAQPTWTAESDLLTKPRSNRLKFVLAGVVVLAGLIYLISQAVSSNAQFYVTVDEYYANTAKYAERDLRIAAFVLGDTIQFTQIDAYTSRLEFDIVDDIDNPGRVLHVVAMNEPLPDLLQHRAQAVVEGSIGEDGAIYANDGGLLLKCPTRYEELEPTS